MVKAVNLSWRQEKKKDCVTLLNKEQRERIKLIKRKETDKKKLEATELRIRKLNFRLGHDKAAWARRRARLGKIEKYRFGNKN